MQKTYCNIHNEIIAIYSNNEEEQFIDNNEKNTVIFTNTKGRKYLKRFILDKCDNNCPTIKDILHS